MTLLNEIDEICMYLGSYIWDYVWTIVWAMYQVLTLCC